MMYLQSNSVYLMCKVFPITLKEVAQEWYQTLKMGCIQSFSQLATMFRAQFITSVPSRKISSDLVDLRREDGETLRQYISRFQRTAMQVDNLNDEVAISAMTKNCNYNKLFKSLRIDPPLTFIELMARAHKYIKLDEAYETQHQRLPEEEKSKHRRHPSPIRRRSPIRRSPFLHTRASYDVRTPYLIDDRSQQGREFTPLNK
ncbi:hypothetical protein JCGZ_00506 [Jatropha curcas]|uniref:Retrotransposon gag domain-containing protein n=1 Tax=Jatropha curcas TaxID=180498 RepID=A0A067JGI6_JATCU|nr:hypothetical protein JCGZ_00506 [Jatropha curcas]